MPRILEKTERRLGERLFIKGERCAGPKCVMVRRAYPPGTHGRNRRRRRAGSEFGQMLKEKQKIRFFYGLDDKEIRRYVEQASRRSGLFADNFLRFMELRLEMAVWRLGLASSRREARQAIVHGRTSVNGRRVRSPAYQLRPGDKIGFYGRGAAEHQKEPPSSVAAPAWFSPDADRRGGTLTSLPQSEGVGMQFDLTKVKEFYSR